MIDFMWTFGSQMYLHYLLWKLKLTELSVIRMSCSDFDFIVIFTASTKGVYRGGLRRGWRAASFLGQKSHEKDVTIRPEKLYKGMPKLIFKISDDYRKKKKNNDYLNII
jgi:hypothetical protein